MKSLRWVKNDQTLYSTFVDTMMNNGYDDGIPTLSRIVAKKESGSEMLRQLMTGELTMWGIVQGLVNTNRSTSTFLLDSENSEINTATDMMRQYSSEMIGRIEEFIPLVENIPFCRLGRNKKVGDGFRIDLTKKVIVKRNHPLTSGLFLSLIIWQIIYLSFRANSLTVPLAFLVCMTCLLMAFVLIMDQYFIRARHDLATQTMQRAVFMDNIIREIRAYRREREVGVTQT